MSSYNSTVNYQKWENIMANINCEVVKCVFNTHGGCSRNNISIEECNGCKAHECSETYCTSFSDKMSEMKNSTCTDGCPCTESAIKCCATSCEFNQNNVCSAEKITVGTAHAKCCQETECDSFKEKK